MRLLRESTSKLLLQEATEGSGFRLWGCADLPGGGSSEDIVPEVWEGEAGEDKLAGEQSFLHEAICLLRGAEMPCNDDKRCRQGV